MVRGACGDCAHSPSLSTKTSCSRFQFVLGEFLVDFVQDVWILGVIHALLMLTLRLLTSLLLLFAVGCPACCWLCSFASFHHFVSCCCDRWWVRAFPRWVLSE